MEGRACGGGVLRAAFGAADNLRGARAGRTYSDAGGRILVFRGDDDHGGIRRPVSGDDHRPTDRSAADDNAEQTGRQAVFGSAYTRDQISKVAFETTLSGVPEDAWDISDSGGTVMAYVVPDGGLYQLHIAGEGGVQVVYGCSLFAGYRNMTEIDLSGADFSKADSLNGFLLQCESLTSLDMHGLSMPKLTDASCMFLECFGMEKL